MKSPDKIPLPLPLPDKPQTKFVLTCSKTEPEIFIPKKNKSWAKKFGHK